MSRCDLDLWFVDFESPWYIRRQVVKVCTNLNEIEQSPAELLVILWILHMISHAVTLTFDLLTLNFYSTSSVMRSNSVQNLSEIE